MKKITAIMLLILLACSPIVPAFAKHKKKAKKHKKITTSGIESISMRHTACFGHCPIYMITANKDGTVVYVGIGFTKDSGAFEKNVGAANTKRLLDEFAAHHIDTCSAQYINRIVDLPGLIYTITYTGKEKIQTIKNANFGPSFLKELAPKFDSLGQVDASWKKIPIPKY